MGGASSPGPMPQGSGASFTKPLSKQKITCQKNYLLSKPPKQGRGLKTTNQNLPIPYMNPLWYAHQRDILIEFLKYFFSSPQDKTSSSLFCQPTSKKIALHLLISKSRKTQPGKLWYLILDNTPFNDMISNSGGLLGLQCTRHPL